LLGAALLGAALLGALVEGVPPYGPPTEPGRAGLAVTDRITTVLPTATAATAAAASSGTAQPGRRLALPSGGAAGVRSAAVNWLARACRAPLISSSRSCSVLFISYLRGCWQ